MASICTCMHVYTQSHTHICYTHTHSHAKYIYTKKVASICTYMHVYIQSHAHICSTHIHTHTQSTSTQKLCVRDRIDDSAILSTCSSCRGSRVGFPAHTSSTASVLGMPTSSDLCGHLHVCCTQIDKQANIQTYK